METEHGRDDVLYALYRIMAETAADCPKFHHDFKNDLSWGARWPKVMWLTTIGSASPRAAIATLISKYPSGNEDGA